MEATDVQGGSMNATDLLFSRSEIEDAMNIGANFIGRCHRGIGEISDGDRATIHGLFVGANKSDQVRIMLTEAIRSVVTVKVQAGVITAAARSARLEALEDAATLIRRQIEKEKNEQ